MKTGIYQGPRLIAFYYSASCEDPAFQIGAMERVYTPDPLGDCTIKYSRTWKTRVIAWLINKLMPRPQ